jgi:hypothetical protein
MTKNCGLWKVLVPGEGGILSFPTQSFLNGKSKENRYIFRFKTKKIPLIFRFETKNAIFEENTKYDTENFITENQRRFTA